MANRATAKIAFGETEISVVYRPQRITFDLQDRIVRAVANDDLMIVVNALCELVYEWDLTGPLESVRTFLASGEWSGR